MNPVPSILVLHGALGAASQMAPVVDALATLSQVHVFDWPGHGMRPLGDDEAFTINAFADVLAREVSVLNGAKPVVFGYSMGGYVALTLEARAPGTFAGIVTLGTKFDWTPEGADREAMRLDASTIAEKVPRFAQMLEARHERAGGWHSVLDRTRGLLLGIARTPALTEQTLNRIHIPVCVSVGSRDDTVSWEESQTAASAMPNATSVLLEDIAHPIERVPPSVIVDLMRRYV